MSSFQVCTTESPVPHLELVLSPLLVTSSSAPGSSTRSASAAVTHRCVTDHARRSDPSHLLPSPLTRHSFLCFLSTSSSYFPLSCADRTLLRRALKQTETVQALLYMLRNVYKRRLFTAFVLLSPGFLLQQKQHTSGQSYRHVSCREYG